jgi:hypothetical protein
VDQRANKISLAELAEIRATGQARARIYATGSAPNQSR